MSNTFVTLTASQTLTNKTLTSPVVNGSPTGTGIPTLTLKKGSGSGDYTHSGDTNYADVDGTNLSYTVTIPNGWKLGVWVAGAITSDTAAVGVSAAITDSSVILETTLIPVAIGVNGTENFALHTVIAGDGASHTVKLQYKTSVSADAVRIRNGSSTLTPTMVFLLTPSN